MYKYLREIKLVSQEVVLIVKAQQMLQVFPNNWIKVIFKLENHSIYSQWEYVEERIQRLRRNWSYKMENSACKNTNNNHNK